MTSQFILMLTIYTYLLYYQGFGVFTGVLSVIGPTILTDE